YFDAYNSGYMTQQEQIDYYRHPNGQDPHMTTPYNTKPVQSQYATRVVSGELDVPYFQSNQHATPIQPQESQQYQQPNVNAQHNIPVNIPTGLCSTHPSLDGYNKNMYTQIIQPNMYAQTQMVSPIQSNMGVSI